MLANHTAEFRTPSMSRNKRGFMFGYAILRRKKIPMTRRSPFEERSSHMPEVSSQKQGLFSNEVVTRTEPIGSVSKTEEERQRGADFQREQEKELSRAADEEALAAGTSPREIEAKNAFIIASRTIVHWERSRPLRRDSHRFDDAQDVVATDDQ
jgi:hypothetical protein